MANNDITEPAVTTFVVGDPLAFIVLIIALFTVIAGVSAIVIKLMRKTQNQKILQRVPERLDDIRKTHQKLDRRVSKLEASKK